MRCWKDAGASARALNVCDGANTAPQTTRAYAMMRASCESADAVLEGCWSIRPCLECLRRCQRSATDDTSICNDACRCGWAGTSARAFDVCDGANTAPQTTRASAMMRGSCESADAVLEGCWDICPCLECLRRCQHSATDDTSICNDAWFMRECRCCWEDACSAAAATDCTTD